MVDYLGLLSSEAAERVERNNVTWWVGEFAPDYNVSHAPYWPSSNRPERCPGFKDASRMVATLPFDAYSDLETWGRIASVEETRRTASRPAAG
jgi:hypothetical protein